MEQDVELLEQLVASNSNIRDHITSMRYLVVNNDVTMIDVIHQSFGILIDDLVDQGIVFHNIGGKSELLADRYNARHLITLFTEFRADKLNLLMKDDSVILKLVRTLIEGCTNANEFLPEILKGFSDLLYKNDSKDMYVFLHDKVTSTSLYMDTIIRMVDVIVNLTDNQHTSIDTIAFINILWQEKRFFKEVLMELKDIYALDINDIDTAVDRFRYDLIYSEYFLTIANLFTADTKERIYVLISEIAQSDPYYIAYHMNNNLSLSDMTTIKLVCTAVSNKRLFGYITDMTHLKTLREDTLSILSIADKINITDIN